MLTFFFSVIGGKGAEINSRHVEITKYKELCKDSSYQMYFHHSSWISPEFFLPN